MSYSEAITKNDLLKIFEELGYTNPLNRFYPVGSYYETSDASFDPNTAWGGTWVLEAEGIVHISGTANGAYKVGTKYGANTKRIEDANIAHGHGFTMPTMASSGSGTIGSSGGHSHTVTTRYTAKNTTTSGNASRVNAAGSSTETGLATIASNTGAHTHSTPNHTHTWSKNGSVNNLGTPSSRSNFNVMQESLAVYRWHRTA